MMKNQKQNEKTNNVQKLLAKTRVVELRKDRKYLFLFDQTSGVSRDDIAYLMSELHKQKYGGIALYMKNRGGVEVYEKQ